MVMTAFSPPQGFAQSRRQIRRIRRTARGRDRQLPLNPFRQAGADVALEIRRAAIGIAQDGLCLVSIPLIDRFYENGPPTIRAPRLPLVLIASNYIAQMFMERAMLPISHLLRHLQDPEVTFPGGQPSTLFEALGSQ